MSRLRASTADRRTVLTGVAASAGSVVLAGCLDAFDGDGDEGATTDTDGNADSSSDSDPDSDSNSNTNANSSDDTSSADAEPTDEIHQAYETTDVRVMTADGDELGSVTAAIADTLSLRTLGLSDTEELPADRGMLFVYDSVDDRRFAMPDMDFGIDIVFADDEGVITTIHHAPEPGPDEDGSEQTYSGRGQYVLEVGYEWTAERSVEGGDVLRFEP